MGKGEISDSSWELFLYELTSDVQNNLISLCVNDIKSEIDWNISRKKSVPKNEAFDSQDTKPYVTV